MNGTFVQKRDARGKRIRCSHGLTDQTDVFLRSDVENRDLGTKFTAYSYRCHEHGGHGTFTVKREL